MELYYEKPNVKISWDEEAGCVFVQWKGYAYGEEFRTGMNKALQLLKDKKTTKVLLDLRKLRITSQEDQEWIEKDWIPRAKAAGHNCAAILLPEAALAKLAFEQNTARARPSGGIEAKYFDSIEDARKWLG